MTGGVLMTAAEIIALKKELGISSRMLSEKSGVPLITIAKIMCGETKAPRLETLCALENGLRSVCALHDSSYSKAGHTWLLSDPAGGAAWNNKPYSTYEDYCALPDGTNAQLISGKLFFMESPDWTHSSIVEEFSFQIRSQIRSKNGSCIARQAPVDIKLDVTPGKATVLVPDFFILCDKSKVSQKGVDGAPDFVLEVLSPSTRHLDIGTKMVLYREYGVREYWIIDPENRRLIIYNFMDEKENPIVLPLEGVRGLSIYKGEITVDLDAVRAVM